MNRGRLVSWLALGAVLTVALIIGARTGGPPPTPAQRAHALETQIRCPTCRSQSMANSDAPAAVAGRDLILSMVKAGQSDGAIRAYFVSKYTEDIMLDPPHKGISALVWIVPFVAVVAAVAGLVLAFRRWKPRRRHATDEDRAIVEKALRS